MSETDTRELEWWRHFATKFLPGDGPRVGMALLGERFVLFVMDPETDEPIKWSTGRDPSRDRNRGVV